MPRVDQLPHVKPFTICEYKYVATTYTSDRPFVVIKDATRALWDAYFRDLRFKVFVTIPPRSARDRCMRRAITQTVRRPLLIKELVL